ncbi:hypothetical protein ACFYU8_29610 [Brevibacillus sp. NPDC003359]|uniref:hypothetical protein n=1 Tax=unclassified Brevibacillus TaxID=2684853 RepID=UPI0036BCAE83
MKEELRLDKTNGKLTAIEWQMLIDNIIEEMPYQIKIHVEVSKLYKARFDALVSSGFTENQALEILKARGLTWQ